MEAYRGWVVRNRQWLSCIESIANTLTWFMPERFSSSELAPEAVSAFVGLLTITNEHIVKTSVRRPPSGRCMEDHQTSCSTSGQKNTFSWPFFISIMKELEVFIEMAAEHYGGTDTKWNAVATVEGIKVLIRLMVLHKAGYRILLDGGETENTGEADEPSIPSPGAPPPPTRLNPMREYMGLNGGGCLAANSGSNGIQLMGGQFFPQNIEGRAMQAMSNFSKNMTGNRPSWIQTKNAASIPPTKDAVIKRKPNPAPTGVLGKLFVMGEVLQIARPLLYVLLIKRYGLKSWKPWLSSLAIDITGTSLLYTLDYILRPRSANVLTRPGSAYVPFSDTEHKELRRRHIALAFYLMRDPFFTRYTRRPLEKVESNLKPAPLIGTLAGKAVELILGVQAFYMYTAAS